MRGSVVIPAIAVAMGCVPSQGVAADTVTVKVKGRSAISEAVAKNDARRNAIEQAGKVHVVSRSEVRNAVLAQDIIKTRADGLIIKQDFKPAVKDAQGVWVVELVAQVSKEKLDATWAEVANVLEQIGQPTIMLFFDDIIQLSGVAPGLQRAQGDLAERVIARPSIVGNQLSGLLSEYGFQIKIGKRAEALLVRDKTRATVKQDFELLAAYAWDNGADLYIEGYAKASGPFPVPSLGDGYPTVYQWKTFGQCKAYWADNAGQLLAPPAMEAESASKYRGDDGAMRALDLTGVDLGREMVFMLLDKLTRRALDGVVISMHIENVKDDDTLFAIEDALNTVEGVLSVNEESYNGSLWIARVKTKLHTRNLARAIVRQLNPRFDGFELKTSGQRSMNVMRLRVEKKTK